MLIIIIYIILTQCPRLQLLVHYNKLLSIEIKKCEVQYFILYKTPQGFLNAGKRLTSKKLLHVNFCTHFDAFKNIQYIKSYQWWLISKVHIFQWQINFITFSEGGTGKMTVTRMNEHSPHFIQYCCLLNTWQKKIW